MLRNGLSERPPAAIGARNAAWRSRQAYADALNPHQTSTLDRLLDGVESRLTSSGWAAMNGCSQDTANRAIRDLVERGILVRGEAGGRSTSYVLVGGRG